MTIYDPPSARRFVDHRQVFSTWIDLLPLGYDLVCAANPRVLVELGVYKGMSYFAFCQAVRGEDLPTRCFGVDSWVGDEHTGDYGEEVYATVRRHNRDRYADFSRLLRTTFEEAAEEFSEGSVDFLHLDGCHTYEAVRGDFETWFPRLRPGGLFLFHDIRARVADFGVWRFWDELEREHETFAFDHGYGLGVLRKAGGRRDGDGDLLRLMFGGDGDQDERLRRYYVWAAERADLERKRRGRERRARDAGAAADGEGP